MTGNPIKETFGTLKNWKIDSQKMKDELRKDWSKHDRDLSCLK